MPLALVIAATLVTVTVLPSAALASENVPAPLMARVSEPTPVLMAPEVMVAVLLPS